MPWDVTRFVTECSCELCVHEKTQLRVIEEAGILSWCTKSYRSMTLVPEVPSLVSLGRPQTVANTPQSTSLSDVILPAPYLLAQVLSETLDLPPGSPFFFQARHLNP